jgi:hypothetical protein
MAIIVVAGATAGVTAGSAHARSKQCTLYAQWLNHDYEKLNFWAAMANSASTDGDWAEWQYDITNYNFWVSRAATDGANAKQGGCAS